MAEGGIAPGAQVIVRDEVWLVRTTTPTADGHEIRALGVSEFVQDVEATFFTGLDNVRCCGRRRPGWSRPSPRFRRSRLFLEAVLRRTPLPQSERGLALADRFLLTPAPYQQRPAELALSGLRPRILLADVVGLGKTLEIGLILAELIRRGRGDRILVVTPQHVLEQFQHELWTRFSIPLVAAGLGRHRAHPAGDPGRAQPVHVLQAGHHLDRHAEERRPVRPPPGEHPLGRGRHRRVAQPDQREEPAEPAGPAAGAADRRAAAGQRHPAQRRQRVVRRADPPARPGRDRRPDELRGRGHRAPLPAPDEDQPRGTRPDRRPLGRPGPSVPLRCPATPAEEQIFAELAEVWLRSGRAARAGRTGLFPYTLLKSFLSSHRALHETTEARLRTLAASDGAEDRARRAAAILAADRAR